jgi:hypothetical protein
VVIGDPAIRAGLLVAGSGPPGSGRTTPARQLAGRLSLPVVERDRPAAGGGTPATVRDSVR